jgi:hypothetical protein
MIALPRRSAPGRGPAIPAGTARLARLGLLISLVLVAPAARAQSLVGFAELQATRVDETTDYLPPLVLPSLTTETSSWRGRLSFSFQQQLWPNLQFQAGGLFEELHGRSQLLGSEAYGTQTRLLPYVLLRLQTPINLAEIGWQRNDARAGPEDSATAQLVRDTYGITLGWTPQPNAYARLSYYRTDDRDGQRELLDRQTDRLQAIAFYRPIDELSLDYRGSWNWEEDQIRERQIDTVNQYGRIAYADQYWDGRLTLSANYDVASRDVTSHQTGKGEIELPVTAIRGLSALDDLPSNVTLAPNPALIDGNREVSAGVNLGVPPPSGDRRLRNIGLDFEIAKAVNAFRVWVDRDLPLEISQTFRWEIWSSPDNVRWVRQQILGAAPFAPFDNYFELRFGAVAARYLKVVVAPLAPGVPNAQDYATINVTELEALLFRETTGSVTQNSSIDQRVYAGAQVVLTREPYLTWDVTYVANIPAQRLASDTLSNVLSLSYRIDPTWLVNARIGYDTGRTAFGRRNAELYGATVTATPISTFSATLSGSGSRERYDRGINQDTESIFLNTTTNLYDGVNLLVGGGVARTVFIPGPTIDSDTVRIALELLPHPTTSVFLTYDRTADHQTGGKVATLDTYLDSSEVSLTWNPVPSFYFFGSYRIENSSQLSDARRLTTTSINWSPFPLGTLRFNFRYEEYYDSLLDSQTRIYGPGVRWYLNPISYLDVYWEMFDSGSTLQQYDRETLAATLRVGF